MSEIAEKDFLIKLNSCNKGSLILEGEIKNKTNKDSLLIVTIYCDNKIEHMVGKNKIPWFIRRAEFLMNK